MDIATRLQKTRLSDSSDENVVGSIRINPKCYTDAFITDPKGGWDIYIEKRGEALDGDIVRVKINPPTEWKLNCDTITNRWSEWSKDLLPIIDQIEQEEEKSNNHAVTSGASNSDNVSQQVAHGPVVSKRSLRKKRDLAAQTNDKKDDAALLKASRLPTNLPVGISKLKVEQVINLPFSAQCIQRTGSVVEIVKRVHTGLAGGFLKRYSQTHALFSPTDSRIPRMLIDLSECPLDFATQAGRYEDVLFVALLKSWSGGRSLASGTLIKIVGDCNNVASRIEALLIEHQIYDTEFPDDAYSELEYLDALPQNWFKENSRGRRDLTKECVFTIDPKTARDLDDAVSIKQVAEQIYEVGVHIADVSYFVKEMSAVDYYARLRTTSVYLVDRVIPMLPRPLCEHMCSLNPNEPKLAFSVIWKMDKYGRIIDEWFGRTIINSCVKLSYEHAQDMIDNPDDLSWIQENVNMPKLHAFDWAHVSKSVVQLNRIARNMRAKRFEGGALKIDQVKLKYELDPSTGFPTGFTFENRTEANYLIEEFMLQANMSVAKKIYKHSKDIAFLRRHPVSCPRLLKEVKEFCDAKGYPLDITSAGSIQKSLNQIKDVTTSKVVSYLLLKAMKNAEYICTGAMVASEDGYRHFALNVPFYTHFTSPIRRYADVIVHRQLCLALGYDRESNEDVRTLTSMAEECNKRKISSKLISDTSQKLYFNLFVQKAGFCELLACVTKIYDQCFEVILVDYSQTGRVYLRDIKDQLLSSKLESFSGVRRLVLNWKYSKKSLKKKAKKAKREREVTTEEQMSFRQDMEARRSLCNDKKMRINEVSEFNQQQVIEVFDVIRVIVTVDEKDVSKLVINLKTPCIGNPTN